MVAPKPLISDRLLDALRRLDESAMPSRCTIYRTENTYESGRRVQSVPVAVGADFACRVNDSSSGSEVERGGMQRSESPLTISVPLLAPLLQGDDEIEAVTTLGGTEFRDRYQVTVPQGPGSYATSLTYEVRHVA